VSATTKRLTHLDAFHCGLMWHLLFMRMPGIDHLPSDGVVDQWTWDGASSSHRDCLFLHDV